MRVRPDRLLPISKSIADIDGSLDNVTGVDGSAEPMTLEPVFPGSASAKALTPGTLYVVATPIGNLEDITLRALRILAGADLVAAEDTRRTGLLLQAYGIKKPLISCFAHNEEKQSLRILAFLREGKAVALVSDAGMPGISDPGARLIRRAVAAGINITAAPGPSAGLTALVISGLDTDMFAFGGFFPRETKEKKLWLERFENFGGTLIFYESPKRLEATLTFLREAGWDGRACCIARELTKRYEELIRGSLPEVLETLKRRGELKGETVVVVGGAQNQTKADYSPEKLEAAGKELLALGLGKKEASRQLAHKTGLTAKVLYSMLLKWDSGGSSL